MPSLPGTPPSRPDSVLPKTVNCVAAFLSFVGYNCEPYNNPADFFLDVINGDSSAVVLSRADRDEGGEPVG